MRNASVRGEYRGRKTAGYVTGLPDLNRELAEGGDKNVERATELLHEVEKKMLSTYELLYKDESRLLVNKYNFTDSLKFTGEFIKLLFILWRFWVLLSRFGDRLS